MAEPSDRRDDAAPRPDKTSSSAASHEPLVVMDAVNKHFGDLHVLKDIDLTVGKGEVVVVIGPSGSGKSTLCRTINRLETYESGSITLDGEPLPAEGKDLARLRADVGMVFQSFNLFAHMTVLENVTLGPLKVRKQSKEEANRRGHQLLERVGVSNQADKYPAQLSGGQQQRVAIARALATRCCCPPDSCAGYLSAWLETPTRSSSWWPRRFASSLLCFRTFSGPSVTFSSTVMCANRLNDWKTMPTSARSRARSLPSAGSGSPSSVIEPDS